MHRAYFFTRLLCYYLLLSLPASSALAITFTGDAFEDRVSLGTSNIVVTASNTNGTKQAGEPNLEGNSGGKSFWWTWFSPQNCTVTIKTAGSDFDTLLGVFVGDSLSNLTLVASSDDTLGPEPLTSSVTFHAPSGTVYQIVVDGYRGDFGEIASGSVVLSIEHTLDRYTVTRSVNDTNRGGLSLTPLPDPDGKYLVVTEVTLTPEPGPGWYFGYWSGDLSGTNQPAMITVTSNMNVVANFLPVPVRTVERSPETITRFITTGEGLPGIAFKVWHSATGTLDYIIETDAPWLFVYPTNGTTRGGTNTHIIVPNGVQSLPIGNYVGTIRLRPLAEGAETKSIAFVLRVDPVSQKIQWQQDFGRNEAIALIRSTSDGGYLIGGTYNTVMRLDSKGSNVWTHAAPASLVDMQVTSDGGAILGGNAGDDIRLERLDSAGNSLWTRDFGGTNAENISTLQQTADGGFVVLGFSWSGPSGNKTSTNYGATDYWLVRLDHNGKRLWDRSYGGSAYDYGQFIEPDVAGGWRLMGFANSGASGNKTNEASGFWVVRVAADGAMIEEQVHPLGGVPRLVQSTSEGGTLSARGGSLGPVIRTDAAGHVEWTTHLPFSSSATPVQMFQTADGSSIIYWRETYCCSADRVYATSHSRNGESLWTRQLFYNQPAYGVTSLLVTPDEGVLIGDGRFRLTKIQPVPAAWDRPHFSPTLGYRFFISGDSNSLQLIETSTNLSDWLPFRTNHLQGTSLEVFDPVVTNSLNRFYRWHPVQ